MANSFIDPTATVTYERKLLTLKRFAAMTQIGATTRESMNIESVEDHAINGLVLRLEADVLTDTIAKDEYVADYSYEVYASPWQHFKSLYMPKWFIEWKPVKYEKKHGTVTVKLERLATYPKANIALQKDKRFFEVTLGGMEYIRDEVYQS